MTGLAVASNRGPVGYVQDDDGSFSTKRGGGGLVSGLGPAVRSGVALWVCAALSEGDRAAAAAGAVEPGVRMVVLDPIVLDRAYNAVANSTLWFLHHLMWNTPFTPTFDATFRRDWAAYRSYNQAFAEALAEATDHGGRVVVQDYHLTLVPGILRSLRPDLRIAHFSHTPFTNPELLRVLPDDIATELLTGMLGADHLGFLCQRWADAFVACAAAHLGVDASEKVGVHPLGVDAVDLRERASMPDVEARLASLKAWAGDRKVLVRVDRTELSKNVVRGLAAFGLLLEEHPELHGRVVHLASAYPSRHDLPEYREYTAEVQRTAAAINHRFATEGWLPIRLEVDDDFPRSLAALRMADVLVINPIRDGMNLVAKEGPILSDEGVALVLSREAGAMDELGDDSLVVNPYDLDETAAAMLAGLNMDDDERRERTGRLAAAAGSWTPQKWFADQLAALG